MKILSKPENRQLKAEISTYLRQIHMNRGMDLGIAVEYMLVGWDIQSSEHIRVDIQVDVR